MPTFNPDLFLQVLALTGAVIAVSTLLSGFVEKTGLPQVAVFLALGALIGPFGMGLVDATVESPVLRVVATLSLALVLFTDAVSLDLTEVRRHKLLAFLVIGPGTLASAALVACGAWWLLGLPPALAAILGASLASTDPVLLRGILKRPGLEMGVRQALRLESGLNDAVLLPVVLVAMTLAVRSNLTGGEWGSLALDMFVLSPAAGVIVGFAAVSLVTFVRSRTGVRRDYESIYSLGVAFVAFAAAEAVHGSGLLAVFAAGLTISALDAELCDCFLEYGETTAEMALMFTFVLLGTSLIWTGLGAIGPATLAFTGLAFVARVAAFVPALSASRMRWRNRLLIAWFGPKGLSSLLLVLLPVFAGLAGGGPLLTVCCLVVLFSVVAHGLSPLLLRGDAGPPAPALPIVNPEVPVESEFISVDQLRQPGILVADARTDRTYNESDETAAGAVRLHPDYAVRDATSLGIPKNAPIAVFCA